MNVTEKWKNWSDERAKQDKRDEKRGHDNRRNEETRRNFNHLYWNIYTSSQQTCHGAEVNTHQRRQSSSPSVSSQHYFNTRQQACPRLAASDRRIRYILFLMPLKVNFELFFLWLMTPDRSWSSPHKGFTKDEHFQLVLLLNNKRICGRHEFMSLNWLLHHVVCENFSLLSVWRHWYK